MFDSAREIVEHSIRNTGETLSPTEIRVRSFLRLYEADLAPSLCEIVLDRIRNPGALNSPTNSIGLEPKAIKNAQR
jgi:hypothetical protein